MVANMKAAFGLLFFLIFRCFADPECATKAGSLLQAQVNTAQTGANTEAIKGVKHDAADDKWFNWWARGGKGGSHHDDDDDEEDQDKEEEEEEEAHQTRETGVSMKAWPFVTTSRINAQRKECFQWEIERFTKTRL
mmetsp:Transcript_40025/g.74603  ORF Transcript_40025/g.74603 Transcript_40025/m.74603 type:complete len:136 (+) Transcript_40025:55-462(+)